MSEIKLPELPESLLPALKLFVDEFDSHLKFFEEQLFPFLQSPSARSDELRRSLQHRFHTIRGSSGFFQLEEVSKAAEIAEHRLMDEGILNEPEDLSEEFKEIISQLSCYFKALEKIIS